MSSTAKNGGGGVKSATVTVTKCTACANGEVLAARDASGNRAFKCVECQTVFDKNGLGELVVRKAPTITLGVTSSASVTFTKARKCSVAGCPGSLDTSGRCVCCEKRAAWELEHRPIRLCVVCGGNLPPRRTKHCEACAPVVQRVGVANSKKASA